MKIVRRAPNPYSFNEAMREAASIANDALNDVVTDYADGKVNDEDDITPYLLGHLKGVMKGAIGGLTWSASVVRHRKGEAAQEKKIGADFIIHVEVNTPIQNYSKGVLVQAKRLEPDIKLDTTAHKNLKEQCEKMLKISAASFVMNYSKKGVRCSSATKIFGSANPYLHEACTWTSYRFFLELFRCPIGDSKITSSLYEELPSIKLSAVGDIQIE